MPTSEYPDTSWGGPPRAYGTGRDGKAVRLSVVHYTAGSESRSSAENGAAYDRVRTDGTSCHVFHDPDSSVQEVLRKDRANSAFHKGNRLGIQHELCGTAQTRAQWLDEASDAILWRAARAVAKDCVDYGLEPRRLSDAEVRRAWYEFPNGPRGICGHDNITRAFPEDGGTHLDPGTGFPWDVFLSRVQQFISPQGAPDMDYNQSQKLDAVFNVWNTVRLDTDGTADGAGAGGMFEVPLTAKLNAIADDVAALKARPTSVVGMSEQDKADIAAAITGSLGATLDAMVGRVLEAQRKAAQAAAMIYDNDPTNDPAV